MKKLFALFTVLLFAGSMMAQNTAKVTENGNYNEAAVTQTGSNDVEIDQVGDFQTATATQNGTNLGGIYQLNDGNNNEATLSQDGSGNEGWINQGMTLGYWADYQTLDANWNNATMTQTGNSNFGSIEQYGGSNSTDGNEANLTQNGNGNVSYGNQGWAYSGWGETDITSTLSSFSSTINISQIHDNNVGNVWQYGGTDNEVKISQDGNSNVASIAQGFIYDDFNYDFTHPVYNTVGNYAEVNQDGDGNIGKAFQLGDDNYFKLTQNGNGNTVGGRGLSGLEASRNGYFAQDGDGNIFVGEQNDGATLDDASFQFGDNNKISLLQGANDLSLIQQTGDLNSTTISQYGGGQDASVIQTGDYNTATVTQH